jgi:alkylresorcinol/alkylpyrone synthase
MRADTSVLGLATAVPPFPIEQGDAARRAHVIFADTFARYPKLADVFAHAGIERRHAVRPVEWLQQPHDWRERTAAYLDGASDLYVSVAQSALARAGLHARDVDVIVTVSSTGIATPSLDARVGSRLSLRPNVTRVPVFGLGCAGGVSGLALASRLAQASPGQIILLVVVELCTLAFRHDRGAKADVVAAALFGDGAAAAVVRAGNADRALMTLGAAGEHLWPSTLDIMGWSVDPIGFGVVLSRALPRFVEEKLAAPARQFVHAAGFNGSMPQFICHPGGAKVLAAVEAALGMNDGSLQNERAVLRDYGNMSAPTVLFVLERALMQGFAGSAVLSALGPGFTASFLAIEAGHG